MLRSVDGWEGEHLSFGAASAAATAAPTAGPTQIAIDNGSDGPSATIPDSHLLFTAQFSRAGADLVLTGEDGKAFVVHDYFANDVHARLLSPEGAALSPDVVAALAGPQAPGQYAQAGTAQPPAQAVGRVVQADSDATIVRNGVAMAAHAGDAILKGDVLQTVAGTFGVTFNDGSTLNLTANSRLVVNEFVYDPKGSANSQLLDLVQGSLTFISGEVAHNGNMKIGTPVATMAIRGTVGGVTTANDGTVNFYVSQSATGAVILDSQGRIIANVVQDGPMILVRPVGPLQVLAEEIQKTPAQLATELAALQQILSIKAIGDQILQQNQQPDPNANPNPQSTDKPHTQFQIDLHFNNPTGPNGTPDPNDGNPAPPTSATVTQTTTDGDGNKTTTVEDVKIPANLAPLTFGPLQQAVNEDTTLVFSSAHQNAISVFDADTASLTVTVAATHGVVSLSGVAGLTFTSGDGSGDATMTFSGTQDAINAALEGMSFTPAAEYSGAASVSVTTNDGHSTSATDTIAITVAAVNDVPILDYFKLTVAEGGTTVLASGDFHITDPDSSSFFFSVANVTGGQFQVFNGETWVSAPTGGFTVSDIAAGNVRFVHDGGNDAPTFTVWASDFTDAGPAKSPTVVFNNANDAPVLTPAGPTLTAISATDTANAGLTVAFIVGTSISDADVGALKGIAVTGAANENGTWQYSIDSGAHWANFGSYSSESALMLAATDLVRFMPDGHSGGSETFSYVAWDQTYGLPGQIVSIGTPGGASAFSIASDTVHLTVNALSHAPAFDSSQYNFTAVENTPPGAIVGTVHASDPDSDALLYSIISGNDDHVFDIDSSGNIVVTGILNYESFTSRDLVVATTDSDLLSAETAVHISIQDVSEPCAASMTSTAGVQISATQYGATSGFVLPGAGNVTTPGTPEDRISFGFDLGESHTVLNAAPMLNTFGFSPIATASYAADDGSHFTTVLSAGDGITLSQTIVLGVDANYFTTIIDVFNGNESDITNVRFMRNIDPDQDVDSYGNYNTYNDVIQNPAASSSVAAVSATGPNSGAEVVLVGADANWRASAFGFTNTNPYASSAFDDPQDPNGALGDIAISLTNQIGTIVAGGHAEIKFITTANVATSGANALVGTAGADTIDGQGGNDLLFGLTGADTFVFHANFGHDTVTDYTPGTDILQFDHTDFADVAALLAATHDNGSGYAVITHDAADTVTLTGVNTATLLSYQNDIHIV